MGKNNYLLMQQLEKIHVTPWTMNFSMNIVTFKGGWQTLKIYSTLEPLDPNSHKSETLNKVLNEPQEDAEPVGHQNKRL